MKKKKLFWTKQLSFSFAIATMITVLSSLLLNINKRIVILESTPVIRYTEITLLVIAIPVVSLEYINNFDKKAKEDAK